MADIAKRGLRAVFERMEDAYDAAFTPDWNPVYHLGALGWLLFWIVTVSGIYVYIFFDTGVTEAYQSLEAMQRQQPWAGGLMRSLHRYASDAMIVVVFVHLAREFALDRMRGRRWFAWFTGVPLLWLIYTCGITGYWLVWDELAQYVAISVTEWLDVLPLFGEAIATNFISDDKLSGRFFSLMVYIHIAVPLLMLLAMWIHVQRYANADTTPPRGLMAGTTAALVVLSIFRPVSSMAPANLDTVPNDLALDWFYLGLLPLLDYIPGGTMWLIAAGATGLLMLLPWLPPARYPNAAVVHLDNCNGCARCEDDCPFGAIAMVPRTDGASYAVEAAVDASKCMACGICAGACPTATPYRRASALIPGIELPDSPIADLRVHTREAAGQLEGDRRLIVYGCEHAPGLAGLRDRETALVTVPCIGMVPPSFVDFALSRDLADGVVLAACRDGSCHHRLGARWSADRLSRIRDPRLRSRVADDRVLLCQVPDTRHGARRTELDSFRKAIADAADSGEEKATT
jgi:quinol-cytochrome oxidoreductase complex cytochrome b subunit/coenzyme F420-reducing hydrogenase delta subunit